MNVWENVLAGRGKSTAGEVLESVDRLKVFGGWLVRNTIREIINSMQGQKIMLTVELVFVPDKNHEWKIKEEQEEKGE